MWEGQYMHFMRACNFRPSACFRQCLIFAMSWIAFAPAVSGQSIVPIEPIPIPVEMGNKEMTYDINAITVHKSGLRDEPWAGIRTMDDGISSTNVSLKLLIQAAYGAASEGVISGLPAWAISERFDVEFKMAEPVAEAFDKLTTDQRIAQRQYMLQLILLDRFNLAVHHTTKLTVIYDLTVVDKSKLQSADPMNSEAGTPVGVQDSNDMIRLGQVDARGTPISDFAKQLASEMDTVIIDKTGLAGRYDLALSWAPYKQTITIVPETEVQLPSSGVKPSITSVLLEQLGLSLTPTMGTVDTVVVDHVQMPAVDYPCPDVN